MRLEDEFEERSHVLALKAALDGARVNLKTHTETREKKRIERQELLARAWQDLLDAKLETKRKQLRCLFASSF